jgi:hypothetical protein
MRKVGRKVLKDVGISTETTKGQCGYEMQIKSEKPKTCAARAHHPQSYAVMKWDNRARISLREHRETIFFTHPQH